MDSLAENLSSVRDHSSHQEEGVKVLVKITILPGAL